MKQDNGLPLLTFQKISWTWCLLELCLNQHTILCQENAQRSTKDTFQKKVPNSRAYAVYKIHYKDCKCALKDLKFVGKLTNAQEPGAYQNESHAVQWDIPNPLPRCNPKGPRCYGKLNNYEYNLEERSLSLFSSPNDNNRSEVLVSGRNRTEKKMEQRIFHPFYRIPHMITVLGKKG